MGEPEKTCLKITVLLPLPGTNPIGGFKVAYEYANFLAKQGHEVSIVHPARYLIDKPLKRLRIKTALRTIWLYLSNRLTGRFKPTSWFDISSAVKLLWVPSLASMYIPDGDIVLATAWETAEWVQGYPRSKGNKFYLIQHLETWSGPEDRVYATWKMPLQKVTIARWLQKIAENFGQPAHLVHNGLDFDRFKLLNPQDNRDRYNILMPFNNLHWKGSADGLAAFDIARRSEPALKLTLFGVDPPPEHLPEGVEYRRNPPQEMLRDLYNQASIYVLPSWTEGFGLPPAEALQCGAALVITDIEGPAAFAIHEKTALLSPVRDPEAMAANILRLVHDPELRLALATNGHALIQEFTWERAGSRLESIFLDSVRQSSQPPVDLVRSRGPAVISNLKCLVAGLPRNAHKKVFGVESLLWSQGTPTDSSPLACRVLTH